MLDLVGFILNRKKSELDLTQDLQFFGIRLRLDLGEASLPESKAWEIVARARHLSSLRVLTSSQVSQLMGSLNWASGLIPMGRLYLRPPSTPFSFIRSDRPVYATASIRPSGPCQPTSAMAGLKFSYLRNPNPHVSGGSHDFYGHLHAGVGRSHRGFQDFGYLDLYRPQAPYQLFGAQSGYLCPTALGSSASGPPGYDRHGQFDSSFLYQQARRDSLPGLATVEVDLFLWLEAQNIIIRARHIPSCLNVIADHLSRPNQPISTEWSLHPEIVQHIFRVWGTPEVDMFATLSNSHLPRFMSNSGAKSPSGGCSVSGLAEEVNVHVSPIPPAHQSHSETSIHSGGRGSPHSPLVADSIVVSTPTMSLCGTPPSSSVQSRSSVPTGLEVRLGRKVVPSARMEALM